MMANNEQRVKKLETKRQEFLAKTEKVETRDCLPRGVITVVLIPLQQAKVDGNQGLFHPVSVCKGAEQSN